jgi:hypothetical protein
MEPIGEERYGSEYVNVVSRSLAFVLQGQSFSYHYPSQVFFCTNSETPMTFREPGPSDYLGSQLREYMFKSLKQREVNLDLVRAPDPAEYILTDKYNPLGELQRQHGLHHWGGTYCVYQVSEMTLTIFYSNAAGTARYYLGDLLNSL